MPTPLRTSCRPLLAALALVFVVGVLGPVRPASALDLSLPDLGTPASETLTPAEEDRIGQSMMREIRREITLVTDPAVNAYIRDLGMRIATASSMPAEDYRFFVIDNDRINAFAMPGGYVGVHSGLITASRNESELGAVIAHEIAHVTQRHIARRIAAAERAGIRTAAMVLAGLLIGTQNPQAGMAAATTGMASGVDSQLQYSRDHEREADRVGIRILANARLDPVGMADFFEVLQNDSRYRTEPPPFLSTHPLTGARIADARDLARSLAPDAPFESPDHAYVRARLISRSIERVEDAQTRFAARLEAEPDDPGARYGLARALVRAGEHDAAIAQLEGLRAAQGENALIAVALAEAELGAGRHTAAIARINRGLSLFPDNEALRSVQVDVLLADAKPQKAAALTRDLVRVRTDAPELWALHARASQQAGDEAESILATARFYAVQGDVEAGLSQLDRLDGLRLTPRQQSRAAALTERWQAQVQS